MDTLVTEKAALGADSTTADTILPQILAALWRRKWLIFGMALLCGVGGGIAAWLFPKTYEAVIIVSPVESKDSSNGIGSISSALSSSQIGGIASLAGLSVGSGSSAKEETIATLQSELITERYIKDNDLLPVLYKRRWDAAHKTWKPSFWAKTPTIWKANQYFNQQIRDLKANARTGLATMTIRWKDAQAAAQWANDLVKLTNDYLRDKAIRESERNISYLNEQIAKINDLGLRQSLYTLMESEIKKEMLARGSEEYALKVIDPAVAPEKAVSPMPELWIAAAFCGGLLLTSLYVALRSILGPALKR